MENKLIQLGLVILSIILLLKIILYIKYKFFMKCDRCGNTCIEVYNPTGFADLDYIGDFCEKCDEEFLNDFYSGKLDKNENSN